MRERPAIGPDPRQIFAYSGLLQQAGDRLGNAALGDFALSLTTGGESAKVCYVPTAVGDSERAVRATQEGWATRHPGVEFSALTLYPRPSVRDLRGHLLAQDLVFVEGGSVVNLLAVWRAHGLVDPLRAAWEAGVVLAGPSAGSLCWHTGGPTDSYRDELDPCPDALGFLPFSNGVHDDFGAQPRRATYRRLVASGELGDGYATEDGVGLHYVGTSLKEAVTAREGSCAWSVRRDPGAPHGWSEQRIEARFLG